MLRHGLHSLSKTFLSPIQIQPVIGAIGGATLGSIISPQWALAGAAIGFISMLFLAITEEIELRMKQYRRRMRHEYIEAEKAALAVLSQEVSSRVTAEIKEEMVRERQDLKTYVTNLASTYQIGEKRVSIYDGHGDKIVPATPDEPEKVTSNRADFTLADWRGSFDPHEEFKQAQESDAVEMPPATYQPTNRRRARL